MVYHLSKFAWVYQTTIYQVDFPALGEQTPLLIGGNLGHDDARALISNHWEYHGDTMEDTTAPR